MQFALVNGRIIVLVQKFYRVFDGDDVVELRLVDEVYDGRERRTFTAPRWACDEDDAVFEFGDIL